MNHNCCVTVPPDSSYKTFGRPLADWQQRLQAGLTRSVQASDHTMGHLEETILRQTRPLEQKLLEEATQKKADQTPPLCPVCGRKLTRRTHDHKRTYQSRFGPVTIRRTRGWCRRCQAWCFPADHALGLADTGGDSPGVQEMAALTVSKLPVEQAAAVIERLTGVKLPRATLDREARRQGQRAERLREKLDQEMQTPEGRRQQVSDLQRQPAPQPFTLVLELDAWNLRERDDWGQTEALRAAGEEPSRWHWVYGGICFRLAHRAETAGGRPVLLSRGTVMTRGGLDALRTQLWAEAMRHGLGEASKVLIVADGAVWIWNLATDRFPQALQRLDPWHALEHLWVVAEALYPGDAAAAKAWFAPLKTKLLAGQGAVVIDDLEAVLPCLRGAKRKAVQAEAAYLETHRERMDYDVAKARGEPSGSGAMESCCRQYQCRFKRPGQFWSRPGDEALMCLETFWRNGRWHWLFPHAAPSDLCKN